MESACTDVGGLEGVQVEESESVAVIARQVPIVESSTDAQHSEAVFTPIKPASSFEPGSNPADNEDSNNSKRMSCEDIETMEILQSKEVEDSKSSWPDTPYTDSQISTPANSNTQDLSANEDSLASTTVNSVPRITDPILKQGKMFSSIAAADLIEYQWPTDGSGDYYMIQEQISTYLGITSFKRKYPEIERRKLDPQEMNHLMLNMLVSEVQLTLGLTAVRSRDVCDMMMKEYPEKYQEYIQVLDEKRKENIKNKHLQYSTPAVEKSQMPNYIKKAMKQVSDFNARLNRQRRDDYSVYYDMQTNVLQFPKHKMKKVHPDYTRPSLYPCALIPGQFQEYCQKYSPDELSYFPLNTVVYGPPPPPPPDDIEPLTDSESEKEMESMETETAEGEKTEKSLEEDDGTEISIHKPDENKDITNTLSDKVPNSNSPPELNDQTSEAAAANGTENSKDIDKALVNQDSAPSQKLEADQSMMSYIDDPDKPICGICLKDETSNKRGEPEDLISCSQCDNYGHPSCLDMSKELVSVIVTYNWQCLECKTCTYCSKPHHEDKMMFCDRCDRGYHTFCVGLRNLPSGLWMCPQCNRSDPDFAKKGRGSKRSGTPRKRKNSDTTPNASSPADTPSKPKRKRRTKKEMEEAREKERAVKEGKGKKKNEKGEKEERKKKKRQKKENGNENEKEEESTTKDDTNLEEDKKEGVSLKEESPPDEKQEVKEEEVKDESTVNVS